MKENKIIRDLWAFVSVDEDGDEGLIAHFDPMRGLWTPLIGADKDRIESCRHIAEQTATRTGRPVRLLHFSNMELLETIQPNECSSHRPR